MGRVGGWLTSRLRYWHRRWSRRPRRYRKLLRLVYRARPRVIVEIGTHRGKNARQMIEAAAVHRPVEQIEYIGFDLFEELTPAQLEREFSLQPPPEAQVRRALETTGASIRLIRGNTCETLPRFVAEEGRPERIDFIFVDGGHSVETIASDWRWVRELMTPGTVVVFDDYYLNDETDVAGVGCQSLIDDLDRRQFVVERYGPEDRFEHDWGTLRIEMAGVRLRG